MSLIAQVAEIAGTTTADVHRVLSHGGTTQTDWAIAHAIHTVTGRDPYELMLTAGREAEVARIWADTGAPAETPAQTNPRAEYDPEVTIYPEGTSPEDSNWIAPHHPGDHDDHDDQEQDEAAAAEDLAATVFSDLAEVLDNPGAAHRLTRAWATPAEGRQILTQVLEIHANTHLRTEIAVRTIEADLAA